MRKHYLNKMKRKINSLVMKKILVVLFTLVLIIVQVGISSATDISDVQRQIQEDESSKAAIEGQISDLEDQKSGLQSYLSDLNSKMDNLNASLNELELKVAQKEQEIAINNQKLEETKALQIQQYDAMKMRIKFMYELQDSNYIDILMSSGSLNELLNRTEYVNKLVEYDRGMLQRYEETKKIIIETEDKLVKEQEELLALKAEADQKQGEMTLLIASTKTEISNHQSEIEDAMKAALEYEQKIREQENTVEKLKEEEARRQAEAAKGYTPIENTYVEQAGDLELMAAIIYCEARGESYQGMLAVGSVVLNRVNSTKFASTIRGVIYQSGQFSPVAAGTFDLVLAQGANETCTNAAREVLNGNIIGNWLYFRTVNNIIQGEIIGNHVFY